MVISKAEVEKIYPMLKYFAYSHLPHGLQEISKPICDIAYDMAMMIEGDRQQVQVGLQKLLEAKDCFVRAMVTL